MDSELKQRFEAARQRIEAISCAYGRDPEHVRLLAVSKTQPAERVRQLFSLGQKAFGENYAQEFWTKAELLKDCPIEWHFIGHLRSSKIKKIVQYAACIQTVADFRHAEIIARAAREYEKTPFPVFIEINADNEAGKSGVGLSEAKDLADRIKDELPNLNVRGVMAIPPAIYQDHPGQEAPEPPTLYKNISNTAKQIGDGQLSLGMTGDMALAIGAGSHMVRIGAGIFGARLGKNP